MKWDQRFSDSKIAWSLFFLWTIWLSLFQGPAYFLDGDDAAIVLQIHRFFAGMDSLSNGYRYTSSPWLYQSLSFFSRLLSLDPIKAFQLLSYFGTLSFAASLIFLSSKVFKQSAAATAAAILIFPEIMASASYANDTAVAIGFVGVAFCLKHQSHGLANLFSAALFAIATQFRFDIVLLLPAYLLLDKNIWPELFAIPLSNVGSSKSLLSRVKALSLGSLTIGIFLALFLLIQKISPLSLWQMYVGHRAAVAILPEKASGFFDSLLAIFPPSVLLLTLAGFWILWKTKHFHQLLWITIGALPVFAIYLPALSTPKYLLPSFLFFVIPIATSLRSLFQLSQRRKIFVLAFVFLLAPYFIVRSSAGFEFFRWGPWLSTHDGPRLTSGMWALPRMLAGVREKNKIRSEYLWDEVSSNFSKNSGRPFCVTHRNHYFDQSVLEIHLIEHSFEIDPIHKNWTDSTGNVIVVASVDQLPDGQNCYIWR